MRPEPPRPPSKPRSLAEAAPLAAEGARPVAGGTALQVEWAGGGRRPDRLVDLSRIADEGFRSVEAGRIGAGVTLAAAGRAADLPAMLRAAIGDVAGPNVRALATIAGNVMGRTGCLIPPLLALGAELEFIGAEGTRRIALEAWLAKPAGDEILAAIHLPELPAGAVAVHRKIGLRRAFSPSVIGVAAVLVPGPDGRIAMARAASGGGPNPPGRLAGTEAALAGADPAAIDWRALRDLAFAEIIAVSDVHRTARYRRTAAANALVALLGGPAGLDALAPVRTPPSRAPRREPPPAGEIAVSRAAMAADWHVRPDMADKVAGRFPYHTDARSPEMLVGRILRAGVPHARIRSIDTRAAEALPGVAAVVTAADVPGLNAYGIVVQDQPALCGDKVRYVGDAVAAVAAVDAATAARALDLIAVDYEPLPVVSDPVAALAPDAPPVHEGGNLRRDMTLERGDVDSAFARCAHVVEAVYTTPRQMHAFMETEGGWVMPEPDGTLTVRVGAQYGRRDQIQLGRILDRPPESIRVVSGPTGGAFGGKDELTVQPALCLLALKAGRPVRLQLDRSESVAAGWKSMPFTIRMRTGCDAAGRILAQELDVVADCGAYASLSPGVLETALEHLAGPYVIPNIRSRGRLAYTNNGCCGAFRGFGANQMTFAVESQVDRLAALCGLDPVAMRRLNLRAPGDLGFLGQVVAPSERLREVLTAAAASDLWTHPRGITDDGSAVVGVGMALNYQGNGIGSIFDDPITVRLALGADGAIEAHYDLVEMGQGLVSVVQASVAAALGCARSDVRPVLGDTALVPDGGSTSASRGSVAVHLGAKAAGPALKAALIEAAAAVLGRPVERLTVGPGGIRDIGANACDEPVIAFSALAAALGDDRPASSHGRQFPKTHWPEANARFFFCFGATIARVSVDRATGAVTVLDVNLHTAAGPVIDAAGYVGQIEGGIVQALGFTLLEHAAIEDGRPAVRNFDGYMVPMAPDAPGSIRVFALPDLDEGDEFGPRGVGELGMGAVTPALSAAIADATGVWPSAAPFRPEDILAALGGLPAEAAP